MLESEAIQTAVMQVAIQAATGAIVVLIVGDVGPTSGVNMVNIGEVYMNCCSISIHIKTVFAANVPFTVFQSVSNET